MLGLFHPVITFDHPGPPSDINISVIRPKETPAKSDQEGNNTGEQRTVKSFPSLVLVKAPKADENYTLKETWSLYVAETVSY